MLGFDKQYPARIPKDKFREKSAIKHSIEKGTLLNFVNLSTIFCLRLLLFIKSFFVIVLIIFSRFS